MNRENTTVDGPLPSPHNVIIELSPNDVRTLLRALSRLRRETEKRVSLNNKRGWTPEPGKVDVSGVLLDNIGSLMDRLPYPEVQS